MLDRRLIHVIAIARCGSFTKAAQEAGLTQSGITKSVAYLERELGYSIFYRTARGAIPTEAGREFISRATRLLDEARALMSGDRSSDDPYAQTLRIGVCPPSVEWLLSKPLGTLLKRHPSIHYELISAGLERITELLRTGKVDVAVGFEDAFIDWNEIKREPIADLVLVPFVRKGHPILEMKKISRQDIARFDFVATSDLRLYDVMLRNLYEEAGVVSWRRHLHLVDYFPAMREIVAASNSISFANPEFAATDTFDQQFARIPTAGLFPPQPMCCAVRKQWDAPPAVHALVKAMKDSRPHQHNCGTADMPG